VKSCRFSDASRGAGVAKASAHQAAKWHIGAWRYRQAYGGGGKSVSALGIGGSVASAQRINKQQALAANGGKTWRGGLSGGGKGGSKRRRATRARQHNLAAKAAWRRQHQKRGRNSAALGTRIAISRGAKRLPAQGASLAAARKYHSAINSRIRRRLSAARRKHRGGGA
jgi:hypothetical protein